VVVVRAAGRLGMIASISPSASRSGAVILSASAASTLRLASRHRIAAQPSGRDDAVDGELLHQHAVADGDPERAAAAPLPADDDDDRDLEHHHLAQVHAMASATPRSSDSTPG
jgi:hypothetical protein